MQPTKLPEGQRLTRTLNGQRIVLIGGTSGFGFATARAAASEGAAIIVASSSKAKVDQAVARLPAGVEGHVLDITREASVEAFFTKIGEFDHLAITAGESLNLGEFATIRLLHHAMGAASQIPALARKNANGFNYPPEYSLW